MMRFPLRPRREIVLALLLACAACALGDSWTSSSAETALGVEIEGALDLDGGRVSKLELIASPEFQLDFESGARLTAIGRARADARDELTPGRGDLHAYTVASRPRRLGDALEVELRELYLDMKAADVDLRIGKQQIVWGEADGLKLLDVVSPQDFREFVLDEFEDSRIPLWSIRAEKSVGSLGVQLIWTLDPTVHELPQSGAHFELRSPLLDGAEPPPGLAIATERSSPRRLLRDSDAGFRLSFELGEWDLTANYLYRYQDFATISMTLPTAPGAPLRVHAEHLREHLIGGTFSRSLGDWVLRGELALSPQRRFTASEPASRDGLVSSPEFGSVLALDWYGLSNTRISAQWFQTTIDRGAGAERDAFESTLTLFGRRRFARERWAVEFALLHNVNRGDGLARARLSHTIRDDFRVWVGLDTFYGEAAGQFGQFRERDRFVVGSEIFF